MSTYSTWDQPMAPINPIVRAVAAHWLEVDLTDRDLPAPVGLLVGEQPGSVHNHQLPLWPWPAQSAGARLFTMSGMSMTDYLVRLARVNMARRPVSKWNQLDARNRAVHLLSTVPDGTRIVLCGARARDAFDLTDWFQSTRYVLWDVETVAIPHPSGRNREYNNAGVREVVGTWIRWAARMNP